MPFNAGLLTPDFQQPVISPAEGRPDAFVAYLVLSAYLTVPITVPVATPFETPPIYAQGFRTFQAVMSAAGGGNLKIDYGVCHPVTRAVLGYRNLVATVAPSTTMFATFGRSGQTAPTLQGDVFTWFTVKITALTATITINELILWLGN